MATLLDEIFQGTNGAEMEFEKTAAPPKQRLKNANDMVSLKDLADGRTKKIDITSRAFQDNFIDNFVRFQVMTPDSSVANWYFKLFFANGKEKKFHIRDVPLVFNPPKAQAYVTVRTYTRPDGYLRDKDGLIYPLLNGKIKYSTRRGFTPKLAAVRMLVDMRRNAFQVMEVTATFGKIIGVVGNAMGTVK